MKKLIILTLVVCFVFSCSNEKITENILENTNEWKLQEGSLIKEDFLLLEAQSVAQYAKEFKNFEMNLECNTSEGAIGSIRIHSKNQDEIKGGYEIGINNNLENGQWYKTGSLIAVRNFGKRVVGNGEWFPIKIQVTGKQIKVFVNNVWIVDYTEPEKPYRIEEHSDKLFGKGILTFVSHGEGKIAFRNINVKGLENDAKTDNPTDIDEQTDEIIRLHQAMFPLIDLHVHLKGGFTEEMAVAISRKYGITYGVGLNCGYKFPVSKNEDAQAWFDTMHHKPFFLAMQGEGREWTDLFTKELIGKFDYAFSDVLTFTDHKDRRLRIWIDEETEIDDKQQFMDMMIDRACTIIATEPIKIFVNPTFLPERIRPEYDQLWTEARMQRIIDACIKNNVAIEINELYNIPSAKLIRQARDAGAKLTFGSNNLTPDIGKLEYGIKMIKECDLKAEDFYIPESHNL